MKKACVGFIIVLFLFMFSACQSNKNILTVKNGTYIMEHEDTDTEILPFIIISDDEISFSYDLLSSYLAYGTFSIKDDTLKMTTYDDKYTYVFQIDGDDLVFQENESSSIKLIDGRLGAKVTDKAIFHLILGEEVNGY